MRSRRIKIVVLSLALAGVAMANEYAPGKAGLSEYVPGQTPGTSVAAAQAAATRAPNPFYIPLRRSGWDDAERHPRIIFRQQRLFNGHLKNGQPDFEAGDTSQGNWDDSNWNGSVVDSYLDFITVKAWFTTNAAGIAMTKGSHSNGLGDFWAFGDGSEGTLDLAWCRDSTDTSVPPLYEPCNDGAGTCVPYTTTNLAYQETVVICEGVGTADEDCWLQNVYEYEGCDDADADITNDELRLVGGANRSVTSGTGVYWGRPFEDGLHEWTAGAKIAAHEFVHGRRLWHGGDRPDAYANYFDGSAECGTDAAYFDADGTTGKTPDELAGYDNDNDPIAFGSGLENYGCFLNPLDTDPADTGDRIRWIDDVPAVPGETMHCALSIAQRTNDAVTNIEVRDSTSGAYTDITSSASCYHAIGKWPGEELTSCQSWAGFATRHYAPVMVEITPPASVTELAIYTYNSEAADGGQRVEVDEVYCDPAGIGAEHVIPDAVYTASEFGDSRVNAWSPKNFWYQVDQLLANGARPGLVILNDLEADQLGVSGETLDEVANLSGASAAEYERLQTNGRSLCVAAPLGVNDTNQFSAAQMVADAEAICDRCEANGSICIVAEEIYRDVSSNGTTVGGWAGVRRDVIDDYNHLLKSSGEFAY